ncbi:MAG: hypothetical protein IJ374_07685, partial [Lachnospiraceae bacterium]|nr:hypothetical protein [Lachnospiraceae bacterium]
YNRALLFNQHAVKQIKDDQIKHPGGFVILAGHAHIMMHEGRDKSRPIQGFSQAFGMHRFEIKENENTKKKDINLCDPKQIQIPVKDPEKPGEYKQAMESMDINQYKRKNGLWIAAKPMQMNTRALEAEERAATGPKLGAHRAASQAKFEREKEKLGFEEITKDDIQAANRNVKKPIIGGHRGPK